MLYAQSRYHSSTSYPHYHTQLPSLSPLSHSPTLTRTTFTLTYPHTFSHLPTLTITLTYLHYHHHYHTYLPSLSTFALTYPHYHTHLPSPLPLSHSPVLPHHYYAHLIPMISNKSPKVPAKISIAASPVPQWDSVSDCADSYVTLRYLIHTNFNSSCILCKLNLSYVCEPQVLILQVKI